MRVFLDSNVLFSACLLSDDRQYAFFALARRNRCRLLGSGRVLDETTRNLALKAPQGLKSLADLGRLLILSTDPSAELIRWAVTQGLPAKDAPILAAAVQARADLLVTGDRRHFGPLFGRTLKGVRVLSLADGLAAVLGTPGRRRP